MVDGIGKSGAGRIELARSAAGQGAAAAAPAGAPGASGRPAGSGPGSAGGVVADLVALGPPVDGDKVSALRQAIAEGRYHADPDAIAERMIAAELGR